MLDVRERRRPGQLAAYAAGLVVVLSVVLAVAFATRFGSDPNLVGSPLIGRPAPEVTLPALAGGEEVRLGGADGQITVVNFFASWCLECRKEHADLVATAEAFAGSDVRFVQVAYQDETAESLAFLDELGWSEHTAYAADPGSRAAIAYGVFGVPETYFIGPDGVVRGKIQGESNALLLGETIDRIRRGEQTGTNVVGDVQSRPES